MDQIDTHRWPRTFDARPGGRNPAPPRPAPAPRLNRFARPAPPLPRAVLPPHAPFPPDLRPAGADRPRAATPPAPAPRSRAVRRPRRAPHAGPHRVHTAIVGGMLAGLLLICVVHALSHFV